MFFKIGVLKNFAVFTGKHQFWSIFLIKLQSIRESILKNTCERLLLNKVISSEFFPFKLLNEFNNDVIFFDKFKWNCGIACLFLVLAL